MARELPIELARHLVKLLQRTRRRYRQRLANCQKHFSEKAVHELRVETRRALALLDLMLVLHPISSHNKARRALKRRLNAFDELRDAQVELMLITPWVKIFPEAVAFQDFLRCRESELITGLQSEIRKLKSRRVERTLKDLEKEVEKACGKNALSVDAVLHQPVTDAYDRVVRYRQKIRRRDTETIHCTRIAFKSFRYLCELLQPLLPEMTPQRLRQMHAWQTRMGDIQDAEVLLSQIERAVKRTEVALPTVKRLHAELARRLVVLVGDFVKAADELERFRPVFVTPPKRTAR